MRMKDLPQGWHRVPVLFDAWDSDKSGLVSRHELALGVRKLCASRPKEFAESDVLRIMDDVDVNNDNDMDPVEFGAFLAAFANQSIIPLEDVVNFLLSTTSEVLSDREENRIFSDLESMIDKAWQMMPHLFDYWDKDGSGTIDRSELVAAVGAIIDENGLPITVEECLSILKDIGLTGDQQLNRGDFGYFLYRFAVAADVTLDELTFYLMKQRSYQQEREREMNSSEALAVDKDMFYLFRLWDKDTSGYLDRKEVQSGLDKLRKSERSKLSLADVMQLLGEADMDKNKLLDHMEFGALLASFALATGVRLDEVTKTLLEEQICANAQRSRISDFLANAGSSLAQEVEANR